MRLVRTRAGMVSCLACLIAACRFTPGTLRGDDANTGDDDAGIDAPVDDALVDATGDAGADAAPLDAPLDVTCPVTYTLTSGSFPNSKYRLVTASASWTAAQADCEDDGNVAFQEGHLVVLDSEAERQFVYQQGTTDKWIGASDRITEDEILAVTNQPAPYFGNAQAQDEQKDCMFTNQNETVMESCTAGFQYICECDGRDAEPANF